METLRFVHAADLHLDSPFQGVRNSAPGDIATALHDATFAAYERIIDLCIAEEAQALLVAGDVYDGADRSLRAQLRFIEGLKRLDDAGIHAFICHGNHDPLDGWTANLDLPEKAHQFGAEIGAIPFGNGFNATVYGISYPKAEVRDDLTPHFVRQGRDDFAIGLLHTNVGDVGEHANYAPCTIDSLAATGIDYWALGHVHTRMELRASNPAIIYPGNIQGRHANEAGDRGVYLVDVDSSHRPALTYLPVCTVRWESLVIDISGLTSERDLLDALHDEAEDLLDRMAGCGVVCRVRLVGRGELHTALHRPGTVETLRSDLNDSLTVRTPFLWCERISVQTAPAFDREDRLQSEDFLADVLRMIDDLQSSPNDLQALVESSTASLYTSSRAARYLTGPNDLQQLLTGAETRILNELLERE